LQSSVEKLLAQLAIEPTTLDLGSQSGAYDLSATLTLNKHLFLPSFSSITSAGGHLYGKSS